jgi:hypothetical protein
MMPARPSEKIRLLTPLQLQKALPTNPILSGPAQGWSGIMGRSPHRFLTDLRSDRARTLLEATD